MIALANKMNRRTYTIFFFIFLAIRIDCLGQKINKTFYADSIFIYKDFKAHGTTANLWHHHKDLDSLKSKKELISPSDLKALIEITSRAETKKLMQMKYGGPICYWIVNIDKTSKRFAAFVSSDWSGIDDLDGMRRWIITEPNDIKKFEEIINKYWL
ncbi:MULTISPECIES: hypothetical protein [unclassified Imperialibacter]|uniref:hypothetical protein n=1 Tax=unclassified Imperialibacter TaxID=2629706 RepID=UPI0012589FE4|nr:MULTISPECIES: hypothetical protein [unclassified Imperialibacter]CAD5252690.1 hypothetical protein IMPERIA75_190008 [Imperialibacter sp. 75]CAD5280893.1 hypothetical protein IMPERIA89_480008 [Imperialibacter sp. 89]VVT28822.1 hypothetical protein IMPR6_470008 [Imperialibacter sp. EC-SDR9]